MDDCFEKFRDLILKDKNYLETLKIVKNNSSGKVWLIGGAVYGYLLFGKNANVKDYDYLVKNQNEAVVIPNGYKLKTSSLNIS